MSEQQQMILRGNKSFALVNGQYRRLYPSELLFGWTEIASAVGSAILDRQAARAWEARFDTVTESTIQELTQRFQDAVNRARIGSATSHFQNAARQTAYYKNDPPNRQSSLHDAEVESGYAMNELQAMGLFSLHTWLLTAQLHMSILQEWLVVHGTGGAQANINLHYDYMAGHFTSTRDAFLRDFDYCLGDFGSGPAYYYCGFDPVHIPSQAEDDAVTYVAVTHGSVDKFRGIVIR